VLVGCRYKLHVLDSRTHAVKASLDSHLGGLISVDAHKNHAVTVGLK
jgi:hypothetical protein